MAELNADQEYSYTDAELIQMMKEATAAQCKLTSKIGMVPTPIAGLVTYSPSLRFLSVCIDRYS
jgi:hypothetical protein